MTGTTRPAKLFAIALFVVYLVLLVWIVLWKLDVPWVGGVNRVIKLVPFAPSGDDGASSPIEVGINLLVFVPVGMHLGLLLPSWPWWKATAVIVASSIALEAVQFALAIGSSDLTDVVVNTAGGLAGLGIVALVRRRLRSRTTTVMTWVCASATAVLVLASAIFIASPIHYAPPSGGPGLSTQSGSGQHSEDAGQLAG